MPMQLARIRRYALVTAVAWTALIVCAYAWFYHQELSDIHEVARAEARMAFQKDNLYRKWAASHGGVYVPVDSLTPPSPYLSHVPERDISTPTGRVLTLMNSAYIMRQVFEIAAKEEECARGHITSLKPIRRENVPDPWESKALHAMERGEQEVSELVTVNQQRSIRLMRPVFAEKGCLKCHASQGYREGDLRGGVSVTVPLAMVSGYQGRLVAGTAAAHGVIWLLGIGMIHVGRRTISRNILELLDNEERYRTVADFTSDWEYWLAPDGSFRYVSPSCASICGYAQDEFYRDPGLLERIIHPEDVDQYLGHVHTLHDGQPEPVDFRIITRDGRTRWIAHVCRTVFSSDGKDIGRRASNRDTTDRRRAEETLHEQAVMLEQEIAERQVTQEALQKQAITLEEEVAERQQAEENIRRLNRLYTVLSKTNEAIIRIREPETLFREVCRIAVEDGSLRMAWLGIVDQESLAVKPVVHYGHEAGYLDNISISVNPDVPEGRGPTGTALREGRCFINNDTRNNPLMAPWRHEALSRGYLSSCSLPLAAGENLIGVVTFYAAEPNFFNEQEIRLLSSMADDLSFGIEFMRKEAERKLAVEALEQEREFLANMLLYSAVATFVLDSQHRVLYWNRTCELLTGVKAEDVVGTTRHWRAFYDCERPCLADIIIDGKREDLERLYPHYFRSKLCAEGVQAEGRFPNLNGMDRSILFDASPIMSSTGTLLGAIETLRDITEQKALETQLIQAQKMEAIGQLAGGVAHDFNNILTAIIGFGSIVEMRMDKDDPQRANVNQILAAADRAADLTRSLLAFSRKQISNPQPMDINQAIRKTEKFLKRIIGEDIALTSTFHQDVLPVNADGGQIEQVLMNLATNARDAMVKGGILTIETELMEMGDDFIQAHGYGKPGRYVLVSVTDSGTGMDEDTRKRLFEPFFTTKEVGRGTGLGLAIVYGIVKQHNGYISVYSEQGVGTTFTVYLPLWSAGVGGKAMVTEEPLQGGTETILVADDDDMLRDLSEKILSQFGYRVITTMDGQDAVDRFREKRDDISLVILDVIMPHLNGREACDEIRRIRPDIKVIFTSGYTADIIHQRGMFDESLEYVAKPMSPSTLLKKVREVLDRA